MTLVILLLLCSLGQDRSDSIPSARARVAPMVLWESDGVAQGMAQSPSGEPRFLQVGPIPAQSIVGLFGVGLHDAGPVTVRLTVGLDEYLLPVQVFRDPFFKIDRIVFRLPVEIHGSVSAEIIGTRNKSNAVSFEVE